MHKYSNTSKFGSQTSNFNDNLYNNLVKDEQQFCK